MQTRLAKKIVHNKDIEEMKQNFKVRPLNIHTTILQKITIPCMFKIVVWLSNRFGSGTGFFVNCFLLVNKTPT